MTLVQDETLNTGSGRCPAEAQVVISAPMSVRMLGEMHDFFATVAAAVHNYNRHAFCDDFVGMGYPEYATRQEGLMRLGHTVILVGSHSALESLLETDRLKQFQLRGNKPVITDFSVSDNAEVVHFSRARHNERNLPGEIVRRIHRFERVGKDTTNLRIKLSFALGEISEEDLPKGFKVPTFAEECFFTLGDKRLAVRCWPGKVGVSGDIRVSTYGFSYQKKPLPIVLTPKPDYDPELFN